MKRPDRSWILVLLAATGAGVPSVARSGAPTTPAAAPTTVRPKSLPAVHAPHLPTRPSPLPDQKVLEVLHAYPGLVDEDRRPASEREGDVFTIVASVPDPDRTDYDLFFDQSIDSIRSAARAARFLPDQYYLPWSTAVVDPDLDIQLDGYLSGETSPPQAVRVKHHHDEVALQTPGVMVFRRDGKRDAKPPTSSDLLVVFVVGETATQGIHHDAMATALRLSDEIELRRRLSDKRDHALLAPFFSKSAASLRSELAEHRRQGDPGCSRHVIAISGSATDGDLRSDSLGNQTCLQTMNHPVTAVHDAVVRSLGAERVAALTEATFWGRAFENPQHGKRNASFEFPLHVARLRAEREKLKQESASEKTANLRTRLELRLDQDHESVDEVSVQSTLTPYGVELMLQQQLISIAREDFHYLAILATDPADLIFLAGEARKYCPQARIFTLESNLLFTHPDVMRDLNGMLVASTYPLTSDHGFASGDDDDRPRLAFASQSAEGIFNALAALLFEIDATPNEPHSLLRDYSSRTPGSPPPIWITTVSNGAFWPFAIDKTAAPDSIMYVPRRCDPGRAHATAPPTILPLEWKPIRAKSIIDIFDLLLSAITLVLAGVFVRWDMSQRRLPSVPDDSRADGLRYWLGIWLPLAFINAHLLSLFVDMRRLEAKAGIWANLRLIVGGGATLIALTMVGIVGVLLIGAIRRMTGQYRIFRDAGVAAIVALLLSLGVGAISIRYLWVFLGAQHLCPPTLLAIDRTLQPLSGVSPGLPLLFVAAGFCAWGYAGLIRVRDQKRLPDATPFPFDEGLASLGLGKLGQTVRSNHAARLFTIEHLFGLIIAALLDCYFWFKLHPTLEHREYEWLFRVPFITLLTLTFASAGRMTASWIELRRLLSRLAGHPMVEAYDRVGSGAARVIDLEIGARIPAHDDLEAAVRMADLLARESPPFADDQRATLHNAQLKNEAEVVVRLYSREARGERIDPRVGTQAELFRLARTVFSMLERLWAGDAGRDSEESINRVMSGVVPTDAQVDGPYRHVPTLSLYHRVSSPRAQIWRRLAEDLVAGQIVTLINLALGRIRTAMAFGMAGALFMVCATSSYSFHPARFVTPFTWLVALSIMVVILLVVVGIERNEILSRIAQTQPGRIELNAAFLGRLAIYGGLPLIALVVTNFPELGAVVLSWIEPLLRALH